MNIHFKNNENTNNQFVIDFFELAFLVEACLPKSTIARHSFFINVIDRYYHQMNWNQRNHLFTWITPKLNMEHEESKLFYARFNPDNQYLVTSYYNSKKEETEAFLFNEKYKVSSTREVNEEYIDSVTKLTF